MKTRTPTSDCLYFVFRELLANFSEFVGQTSKELQTGFLMTAFGQSFQGG